MTRCGSGRQRALATIAAVALLLGVASVARADESVAVLRSNLGEAVTFDTPWITVAPDGSVLTTWIEHYRAAGTVTDHYTIGFARQGVGFGQFFPVDVPLGALNYITDLRLVVDAPDNRVLLVYNALNKDDANATAGVWINVSTDPGATWGQPQRVYDEVSGGSSQMPWTPVDPTGGVDVLPSTSGLAYVHVPTALTLQPFPGAKHRLTTRDLSRKDTGLAFIGTTLVAGWTASAADGTWVHVGTNDSTLDDHQVVTVPTTEARLAGGPASGAILTQHGTGGPVGTDHQLFVRSVAATGAVGAEHQLTDAGEFPYVGSVPGGGFQALWRDVHDDLVASRSTTADASGAWTDPITVLTDTTGNAADGTFFAVGKPVTANSADPADPGWLIALAKQNVPKNVGPSIDVVAVTRLSPVGPTPAVTPPAPVAPVPPPAPAQQPAPPLPTPRPTIAKTGSLLNRLISVAGAGRLDVRLTAPAATGHAEKSKTKHPLVLARKTIRVRRAGAVHPKLTLTKAGRALLKERHKVTATLSVTYAPATGASATTAVTGTLRSTPVRKRGR